MNEEDSKNHNLFKIIKLPKKHRFQKPVSYQLYFLVLNCKGATHHWELNTTFSHEYQWLSNLILDILKAEKAQACIRTFAAVYYETQLLSQDLFTKRFPPATLSEPLPRKQFYYVLKVIKIGFCWISFWEQATDQKTRRLLFLTCNVFPRPIQWARMHPEPGDVFVFFTDSQQQSHMNWTPEENDWKFSY